MMIRIYTRGEAAAGVESKLSPLQQRLLTDVLLCVRVSGWFLYIYFPPFIFQNSYTYSSLLAAHYFFTIITKLTTQLLFSRVCRIKKVSCLSSGLLSVCGC